MTIAHQKNSQLWNSSKARRTVLWSHSRQIELNNTIKQIQLNTSDKFIAVHCKHPRRQCRAFVKGNLYLILRMKRTLNY